MLRVLVSGPVMIHGTDTGSSQLTMLTVSNAPHTPLEIYSWCLGHHQPHMISHSSAPLYSPLTLELLNRSKCRISPAMIWKENDEREPGEHYTTYSTPLETGD